MTVMNQNSKAAIEVINMLRVGLCAIFVVSQAIGCWRRCWQNFSYLRPNGRKEVNKVEKDQGN